MSLPRAEADDPAIPRYRARDAWRNAWGVAAVRAHDGVLGLDCVLVRTRAALAGPGPDGLRLHEPFVDVPVLGVAPDGDSSILVERDIGQRLLPERLSTHEAVLVATSIAGALAQLEQLGPEVGADGYGTDAIRVLPGGHCTLVPAAARPTTLVADDTTGPGGASSFRRIVAQLREAVVTADGEVAPLDRLAVLGRDGATLATLAIVARQELAATGIDPRMLAQRLAATCEQAEQDMAIPALDAGPAVGTDAIRELDFDRWDDDQLEVRTWHGSFRRPLLLALPMLVLVALLATTVLVADRGDREQASFTPPVERLRAIATSTGDEQRAASSALENWKGDADGVERLRRAGADLQRAADAGLKDASRLQLTSVSEAQAHGALRGMLAGQSALGDTLASLPPPGKPLRAVPFQDVLLRSRVVTSDFIALGVALGSLGQKALPDDGYGALPEASEHGLDVAIREESRRLTSSTEARQRELQRDLQDRLAAAMREEQARAEARLRAAEQRAGSSLGSVEGKVLARMAAAWETRFAELSARATRLRVASQALRADPTLGCSATTRSKLEALGLERQQLVLELNTTAAPTEDGLRRQVGLVRTLGADARADQGALLRASAAQRSADVAPTGDDPPAADADPNAALRAGGC